MKAATLAKLIQRIADGTVSNNAARQVFDALWTGEGSDVDAVIEAKGLKQMNDSGALEKIVDEVIAANAANVEQIRAGKDKAFNALVGQAMKATKGKANPQQVGELLRKKLGWLGAARWHAAARPPSPARAAHRQRTGAGGPPPPWPGLRPQRFQARQFLVEALADALLLFLLRGDEALLRRQLLLVVLELPLELGRPLRWRLVELALRRERLALGAAVRRSALRPLAIASCTACSALARLSCTGSFG